MSNVTVIDFGHRKVRITVGRLREWSRPGADLEPARRAFHFKRTPEALDALRGLLRDVAEQTPGARLFKCGVCRADTYGAEGVIGPELCEPCYALAGIDNTLNDEGRHPTHDEGMETLALRDQIARQGGDDARVKAAFDYIWPDA